MSDSITTVGELIAALVAHDPATPVRIATAGAEFMDYTIERVTCSPGDTDNDCDLPNDTPVVHIAAKDSECCCLPDSAATALGWM
ncbi:hypothetical protein [Actinokineospora globicatena]|uniref:hypothetical protein n=1 Tax=Actinokineospora globicatena TaxID=103729 RepID=UPI0020A3AB9F|nr:hypothetical protein [Actinokineospora globicatena]MCP2304062.1 hypothetical protein [Actinokineospora globicatena]GLW78587.1 hypothetical protein Aglo01_30690 [Actinokineospora globicatena]GLW84746.1 hypothetical protein Aglo02_23860 [Actinokineospora globicatena]